MKFRIGDKVRLKGKGVFVIGVVENSDHLSERIRVRPKGHAGLIEWSRESEWEFAEKEAK